jgi:xanthine dehydrogenase molybdenum-binding subunit
MATKKKEYKVIGSRPVRHDGVDKVTGKAIYSADFSIADLLHGKVLRSPIAHGVIKNIDTSKAENLPGVRAIVTAKDFIGSSDKNIEVAEDRNEGETTRLKYLRDNVLASDKLLYIGQPVVAVAATSPHIAEEAISLINLEFETLEPVLNTTQGLNSNSIIHEELQTKELGAKIPGNTNLAEHIQHKLGDPEEAFKHAEVIVERELTTETVHQGYIEPHAATASWSNDGRITIWCSTQGAFPARDTTADILGVPISQIKVVPLEIGGGFGGKIPVYLEPVAALLSKATGHPVKLVMSRKEVFECTGPTPGTLMRVKIGADKSGKFIAAQAHLEFEAGAFPGSPVAAGSYCVFAAYDIPNVLIDGYDIVVNKAKTAAYRAPGATMAAFATETVVDELAEKLQMDPMDIRLINTAKKGTRRADGPTYPTIGCEEVIKTIKNSEHYNSPITEPYVGRGVAIGYWFNVGLESACTISLSKNGTINLIEGSTDIGGTRTSIAMQAAEVLGLLPEEVIPSVVDTDSIGFTSVTGGSRTTYATGWAAYDAAIDVKNQMISKIAGIWSIDVDNVEFEDGVFFSKQDTELKISFKELAAKSGAPIVGRGSVSKGGMGAGGGSFAGAIVDVKIDPETGKTTVLKFTCVQDAGKAIYPSFVEGQMQGGSAQGIGWALNEEYFMTDDGRMTNSSLLDYRMPTSLDLPMIDTIIVEVPSDGHPYGVRGIGEANIVSPPAAVANAIYHATGVRQSRLPMNPASITKGLQDHHSDILNSMNC